MLFFKTSFSILVIILSVLAVYTKDSDLSVKRSSDLLHKSYANNGKVGQNSRGMDSKNAISSRSRSFGSDISSIPHILAKRIINISESVMGRSLKDEEKLGLANFMTSRLVGVSESIMGWVEKSVDDLPNFPRMDAQECMKRCICEAHNQPKKYGLTGLVLQLFFPPYTEAEEPLKVVSKYQLAARYGRQDNANCAAQYDGCLVNFLDIIQGLINLVF